MWFQDRKHLVLVENILSMSADRTWRPSCTVAPISRPVLIFFKMLEYFSKGSPVFSELCLQEDLWDPTFATEVQQCPDWHSNWATEDHLSKSTTCTKPFSQEISTAVKEYAWWFYKKKGLTNLSGKLACEKIQGSCLSSFTASAAIELLLNAVWV